MDLDIEEIANRLHEHDPFVANVIMQATIVQKKYAKTHEDLLRLVIIDLAICIADRNRRIAGIIADAEGKLAAIDAENES